MNLRKIGDSLALPGFLGLVSMGMSPIDPLLPIGEAARILGISVDTLRVWEAAGTVTAERSTGGQRRFRLSEIQRVVERAS